MNAEAARSAVEAPTGRGRTAIDDPSDGFNPIFVREIQRSFSAPLFALLLVFVAVLAIASAAHMIGPNVLRVKTSSSYGGVVFNGLLYRALLPFGIADGVWRAFLSLRAELRAKTLDDLSLSGLTPTMLVRGHVHAASARFLATCAFAAPIAAAAYALRGISLAEMGVRFTFVALTIYAATYVAVHLACFSARSRTTNLGELLGFVFLAWLSYRSIGLWASGGYYSAAPCCIAQIPMSFLRSSGFDGIFVLGVIPLFGLSIFVLCARSYLEAAWWKLSITKHVETPAARSDAP